MDKPSVPALLLACLKHSFNPSLLMMPNAFRMGGYISTNVLLFAVLGLMIYATLALSQTKAIIGKGRRRHPEQLSWSELCTYLFKSPSLANLFEDLTILSKLLIHLTRCSLYTLLCVKVVQDLLVEFFKFELISEYYLLLMMPAFVLSAILTDFKLWFNITYVLASIFIAICVSVALFQAVKAFQLDLYEIDAWGDAEFYPITIGLLFFAYSYMSPLCNNELMVKEPWQYRTLGVGCFYYTTLLIGIGLFGYIALNEFTHSVIVFRFRGTYLYELT